MNVYTFIYNLQEEAHRFALKHSSKDQSKKLTRSSLTKIQGIGEKKAKLLLSAMPMAKIKVASVDDLVNIKGVSKKDAEAIHEYFTKNKKSKEDN
jgi:excinuclease ABC subunit C